MKLLYVPEQIQLACYLMSSHVVLMYDVAKFSYSRSCSLLRSTYSVITSYKSPTVS